MLVFLLKKMWVVFAKATHIFSANTCELDIVLTRAVNILRQCFEQLDPDKKKKRLILIHDQCLCLYLALPDTDIIIGLGLLGWRLTSWHRFSVYSGVP